MKKLNWILGFLVLAAWGCDPKVDPMPAVPAGQGVKKAIFDTMAEWYLWNQELHTMVDFSKFDTNEVLLDGIIFKPINRFSYLTTQEAFNNAFVGRSAGHG